MADARNIALLFWKIRREESRKFAENRAELARRRLYRYLRRRCLVSSVFLMLLTRQLFQCTPSLRRVWSKSRSQSFWEETCQGWSDNDWVENFRMSKDSFEYLCTELSLYHSQNGTRIFVKPLQFAIALQLLCIGLPTPLAIELLGTCLALENPPCVPS